MPIYPIPRALRSTKRVHTPFFCLACLAPLLMPVAASADTVASDLVPAAPVGLINYDNPWTGAFGSLGDGFQIYQRGVSPTIPFAVVDDSETSFPPDSLGIVDENNTDPFFGVVDTVNGDTNGPVSASWTFDISGAQNLKLTIDMAAMGDFEGNDTFVWSYSIDGGASVAAFNLVTNEAGIQEYVLAGGNTFTLNDPLTINGTTLTNNFQTISNNVAGTGNQLVLTLTVMADGGSEAVAFRNILITNDGTEPPPPPPISVVALHDIQGSGNTSPLEGQQVATEGNVVTLVLSDGFFIQSPDDQVDADPQTSNGLFVFARNIAELEPGDVVNVSGTVTERFGSTQLSADTATLTVIGMVGLPSAATVTLPVASLDDWEPLEGMLVSFPQTLFVSGNFTLGRFGELDLSSGGPLDNPTNVTEPGLLANLNQLENNLNRIQLDDGSSASNPVPLPPYFGANNTRRTGDSTTGLTGVINYAFGNYEVLPTQAVEFVATNPRPDGPPEVGGELRVGAYNVLNYFTTIDNAGAICGPSADQGCRGADTQDELDLQRAKLVTAITKLDAHVLGLIEIENAAGDDPAIDLVNALNAAGPATYAHLPTGAVGTDAIRGGFIYQPSVVSPVGPTAVLDGSVDPRFLDTKNRPAVAQGFVEVSTGDRLNVVVNHLKSKGSPCDDVNDPNIGDGQGNCNGTRTNAALALADWLSSNPVDDPAQKPAYLIVGDLNAYAQENPITAIVDAGYTDLVANKVGTGWDQGAYSFNFFSQSGYLDHALANDATYSRITGVGIWHINADEPSALDYNNFNQDELAANNEFRSSDHDPIIVGLCAAANFDGDALADCLDTDDDNDGLIDALDLCPATVLPEPIEERNKNRYALSAQPSDSAPLDFSGPSRARYTSADTYGCSCTQILEYLEEDADSDQFVSGCTPGTMKRFERTAG